MAILFPAYRQYTHVRAKTNDAIIALSISTKISVSAVQALNPDALLVDTYVDVADIGRLNRNAADGAIIIKEAERDLVYMAIPYVLATYSSFLINVAKILEKNSLSPHTLKKYENLDKLTLEKAHEYISECTGLTFSLDLLDLFHLSRHIRNRIIHNGSTPGSLKSYYYALNGKTRKSWEQLAGRSLPTRTAKYMELSECELRATLAVCHRLSLEVNSMLSEAIDRYQWLSIAIEDYLDNRSDKRGSRQHEAKKMQGYVKMFYGELSFTPMELEAALKA